MDVCKPDLNYVYDMVISVFFLSCLGWGGLMPPPLVGNPCISSLGNSLSSLIPSTNVYKAYMLFLVKFSHGAYNFVIAVWDSLTFDFFLAYFLAQFIPACFALITVSGLNAVI